MIVTVDQKRRVVLPKPVQPGDALEVASRGDRIVLHILKKPAVGAPPVAEPPSSASVLVGLDLDEPAFSPLADESLA
jgi:hypothetical protein